MWNRKFRSRVSMAASRSMRDLGQFFFFCSTFFYKTIWVTPNQSISTIQLVLSQARMLPHIRSTYRCVGGGLGRRRGAVEVAEGLSMPRRGGTGMQICGGQGLGQGAPLSWSQSPEGAFTMFWEYLRTLRRSGAFTWISIWVAGIFCKERKKPVVEEILRVTLIFVEAPKA